MRQQDELGRALEKLAHFLSGGQRAIFVQARNRIVDNHDFLRKHPILV